MEKNCKNCGNGWNSSACLSRVCSGELLDKHEDYYLANWIPKPKPKMKTVSASITMEQYNELMKSAKEKGIFLAEEIRDRLFIEPTLLEEKVNSEAVKSQIVINGLQEELRKKQLTIQTQREKIEELERKVSLEEGWKILANETCELLREEIETLRMTVCSMAAKQEGVL